MKKIILIVCFLGCVVAAEAKVIELSAEYDRALDGIMGNYDAEMGKLGKEYLGALETVRTKAKKAGDLKATLAAQHEIKRYRAERNAPAEFADVKRIHDMQAMYEKRVAGLDRGKAKSVCKLSTKYDNALAEVQKNLVRKDNIEEAQSVKNERDRASSSEAVTWAEEFLAEDPTAPKAAAAAKPTSPKKGQDCQIFWSCADGADVYLNGEPLREYAVNFYSRGDEARMSFQTNAVIAKGDVITIGARRGGSYGVLLAVVNEDEEVIWHTSKKGWKSYEPGGAEQWHLPSVAAESKQRNVHVQNNPYGPQNDLQRRFGRAVRPIWSKPAERTAFLVSTYQ